MASDGLFTHPGPDGIFGRGGPPGNGDAPPIDGDGTPLRETLIVAYPSPGHMRVARAIRHPASGKVEFQEEYREPTEPEVAFLKEKGVTVGPGSMVVHQNGVSGLGAVDASTTAPGASGADTAAPSLLGKMVKIGAVLAVGAAGFWAVNKWVVPMVTGSKGDADADADEGDDGGEEDEVDA